MKRILFVVLAGVLMVPGAWAYSLGERAGFARAISTVRVSRHG